jgi:hypothetical protein
MNRGEGLPEGFVVKSKIVWRVAYTVIHEDEK